MLVGGTLVPILRTLRFFRRPLVHFLRLLLIIEAILMLNDLLGIVLQLMHGFLEEAWDILLT